MKAGATVPLLDDNRYTTFDSNGQKGSRRRTKHEKKSSVASSAVCGARLTRIRLGAAVNTR